MRKYLIAMALCAMLLAGAFGTAKASTSVQSSKKVATTIKSSEHVGSASIPNISCGNCVADGNWNGGTTYGGGTSFTVDRPGINNTSGWYEKYMQLSMSLGSKYLRIGEIVAKGSPSVPCHINGHALDYWYFIEVNDGAIDSVKSCITMPSADDGKHTGVTAAISSACNTDGGPVDEMAVTIDSPTNGLVFDSCVDTETPSYDQMILYALITDTFTDHHVYGGNWEFSQWVHGDGSFTYQTTGFGGSSADNPIQMYWETPPSPGNFGGNLYSCAYPSGSTCNLGS